jgi:hypothetical protein
VSLILSRSQKPATLKPLPLKRDNSSCLWFALRFNRKPLVFHIPLHPYISIP